MHCTIKSLGILYRFYWNICYLVLFLLLTKEACMYAYMYVCVCVCVCPCVCVFLCMYECVCACIIISTWAVKLALCGIHVFSFLHYNNLAMIVEEEQCKICIIKNQIALQIETVECIFILSRDIFRKMLIFRLGT